MNILINLIISSSINTLIINHKDRLLRFGSEIIFKLCENFKVKVVIIEQAVNPPFEQELASTVIEIMTVFCAKLYGKRANHNKNSILTYFTT